MKNIRFLTFVLTIGTLLLSACGAAATAATPAPLATSESTNVDAMPVAFVGIVDSIAGDQWVISGTTVTVDAAIVRNGPFGVGDRIKVEGFVNPDGSLTVSRVETPTPQDVLTATPFVADNSNDVNANVNDGNINDDNSNSLNSNDDNSNTANSNDGNVNDDNGGNGNSSDDNSNTANSNDDNSNASNSNDDNGGGNSNDDNGGSNSNDDNGGGNSNDDNGGGGNSNDDNGGGGNSNDDNGNGG